MSSNEIEKVTPATAANACLPEGENELNKIKREANRPAIVKKVLGNKK